MSESSPDDDLGFRVLRSIRQIVRQVSRHSRAMSRQTGLTVPQILCMQAIAARPDEEVTLATVADEVSLSRSTASEIVSRLVELGLVDRGRSTVDRRRLHLRLTEAGRIRLDEGLPSALQETFLERLDALPESEQARISNSLDQVVRMMDAESLDAAPMLVPGADAPR
jgi:DNA-binding MarR family transcriptional regulator